MSFGTKSKILKKIPMLLKRSTDSLPWSDLKSIYIWPHAYKHTTLKYELILKFSIMRIKVSVKNISLKGFPGGAVVKNPPANAGDMGSCPGPGRSHMPRSGWAREPQLLSLRVWSLCSATGEAATVRGPHTAMKSGPRLPQLEKALAQKRRPSTAKNR